MKQVVNFRLSQDAIAIIAMLKSEMHTSGTNIVEEALRLYAKKMAASEQPLLKHAGKLSAKNAEKILKTIRKSRKNKNVDFKL